MARLPRLTIAGLPHVLSLAVQHEQTLARDAQDRDDLLGRLREAAAAHQVALHAYAIDGEGLDLLATPPSNQALGRFMQALARSHAAAFNRRHSRHGGLWAGRYRAAPMQVEPWLLRCMRWVEQRPQRQALGRQVSAPSWTSDTSSAAQHIGSGGERWLADPAPYWALGNTPFERELAYRSLLHLPIEVAQAERIAAALRGGWFLGDAAALKACMPELERRPTPRAPGRPRSALRDPK